MAKVLTEAAEPEIVRLLIVVVVVLVTTYCFVFSFRKVVWHALLLAPFKGGAGGSWKEGEWHQ